jgi:hypothetical protein
MNINTETAQVDLSGYSDWYLAASLSANGEEVIMADTMLTLPAYGIVILLPV